MSVQQNEDEEDLFQGDVLATEGRIVGVDFGTVRIGLASCDPSQRWVTPLDTYNRRNERLDGQFFCKLANEEAPVGWVLGLPIHCDGKESKKSKEVREFAVWLKELTSLPVAFFDERFTTAEAKRLLREADLSHAKRKKTIDRLAAHLILTHFLDSQRSGDVGGNRSLEG